MNIFTKYTKSIQDYLGSYKLTISGEIKICDIQGTKILQLTADEKNTVDKLLTSLQEKFQYLDVQLTDNLVEASIKFFAYEKYIAGTNFLENFRSSLAAILQEINSNPDLLASVNASGCIVDKEKKQQFLFLSKASIVEYKITDTRNTSGANDIVMHKIMVYGITLLFITLICYELYVLYKYIPDHDPSKLLVKIISV